MRIIVLALCIMVAIGSLAGVMAAGGSAVAGEGLAVASDVNWLKLFPTENGPLIYEGGTKELVGYADETCWSDGDKLGFDFAKGADGQRYGFQPASRYEFDMLFQVVNTLDQEVCVAVDVTGEMADHRDKILMGPVANWTLAEEYNRDDPESYPWPNIENERKLGPHDPSGEGDDRMWVSVHFDIPADATLDGDVSGTILVVGRPCKENQGGGPNDLDNDHRRDTENLIPGEEELPGEPLVVPPGDTPAGGQQMEPIVVDDPDRPAMPNTGGSYAPYLLGGAILILSGVIARRTKR